MTDGEFNSLRTMGSEQPISILQLISDSRTMARSTRLSQIEQCFKLDARGKGPFIFNEVGRGLVGFEREAITRNVASKGVPAKKIWCVQCKGGGSHQKKCL